MSTSTNSLIDFAVAGIQRQKAPNWGKEEEAFLSANLGILTDAQIGERLGRSEIGVHLHWIRDMQLPSPSKAPGVITAHKAARMLGIDSHKIAHWVDKGFIPGRQMAGGTKIRLIEREAFKQWVLNTANWMYFDIGKVQETELKRLLKDAAKRWGDEWWPTPKVAKYHGVGVGDVKRYIKMGRIKATQIRYSYGGRHPDLGWKLWFVLKSEATRRDLKFVVRRYKNTKRKRKAI